MATYNLKLASLKGDFNIIKLIPGKNHFEIEAPMFDDTVIRWLDEFLHTDGVLSLSDQQCK